MNEIAKAITEKDGAPLSIYEHDEIVRRIKCEVAQAHKEMLESMNMVPKGMFIISTSVSLYNYYPDNIYPLS